MILVMLNRCFLSSIPPPYMPEVGTSAVQTVEDIKGRLRSYEMRKAMQKKIEDAEAGVDEVKRAAVGHSNELVRERLAEV